MSAAKNLRRCLLLSFALIALLAPAGAQAEFGIQSFSAVATNSDHSEDTLAGSHPYEYTLDFTMNQHEKIVDGTLSELFVDLPAGFVGNPLATPRCSRADFVFNFQTTCPGSTQVGTVDVEINGGGIIPGVAIYNLSPTPGSAATLGTHVDIHNALQDASVRTGSDYGVTVGDLTVPTVLELQRVTAHIWGTPAEESHDPGRFCIPADPEEAQISGCPSGAIEKPFLTLPTRCGEELETTLRVRSVQGGSDSSTFASPALSGCEGLGFSPTITAKPETAAADSPSGLAVGIHIPQSNEPGGRSSAQLRDTVLTLPAGLAVNASAANGRSACTLAQVDLKGASPANCPDASKVGTVSVSSPLVDHPLLGSVYLARQSENPFGSLLALYIAVNDPVTGVVVKQAVKVEPDPSTGQLTAYTENIPQLPFEDLNFNFFGGPRASLTTPPTCGSYPTSTQMTPWSAPEGKTKEASDSFQISQGAQGGACPASEAQMPSTPVFEAGTTAPLAGAFSPFVLKLTRENGSQRLSALNVTLPAGLTAKLAGVSECSEPEIAAAQARTNPGQGAQEIQSPSCPQSSEVGTVTVGAGSGTPIYVQGHAYLAGPYKGAPLSFVIITPAVAGPFDLGVVVVRTALFIDETTAQVTAKSDPIPQILQGIPLGVRSIAVHLDRSQFSLNPTNCEAKKITGEAISPIGTTAPLSAAFNVAGCRGLDFTPKISLSFKGGTKRAQHPAFRTVITQPKGQANFGKVSITLPSTQFIDQNHIGNPCTRPKFAAHECPRISELGTVTAYTPLLDKPLSGKVYFRANGGVRPLPDIVADLNGQIHFVLVGFVDSVHKKGSEQSRVRATFAQNPDAPVSKVVVQLFGGKRGTFVNSQNLCTTKVPQRAIVKMAGQNGKAHDSEPLIANSCSQKKSKRAARHRGR
jgi:hypothetical protein